jgi:hypothetical protein
MTKPSWSPIDAGNYLSNLTDQRALGALSSVRYLASYHALLGLAASVEDDERHDGLVGLACATYGWMPTIMGSCEPSAFGSQKPICEIRTLSTNSHARAFLENMDIRAPINGSWVGTSKFMHFLNADRFPIWDSRVAKNFGLKWSHQINNKSVYLTYFDFVHSEIGKGHQWLDAIVRQVKTEHGYCLSPVRSLELMLFARQWKNEAT